MNIKSYKRRPIVEAAPYDDEDNLGDLINWCGKQHLQKMHDGSVLLLPANRQPVRVELGDYIVRNEFAEWEAYKPWEFARLFGEILA